ncbi:low-density lipoprotein receptor-related protein 1B-like [Saccostrea cucullata]|uniref:low-density lipoprotein receptor-related protein 1B-like n=1 Tax=Saccostrea cuccullata TaxID=36930 RepID=UPI002ED6A438
MCSKQQCSEMCSLSLGQIKCICYDWHTLQLNNRDCVPPQKYTYSGLFAVVEQQICVTDIAELVKREENDLTFYCLNIARNVTELEIDVRTKTMYYISTKENDWILSRHNLGYDGSFALTRSNYTIKGLSVNKNDSSLFYGDGYTIKRIKETEISTVVGIDDDVQDLTVDSEKSFLFWVTLKNYYIWRCNTDGSDIRRLIAALNINRLSVFPKQKRLFWTAYGGIMSSELDGAIVNVNIVKYGNIREISFYEISVVQIMGDVGSSAFVTIKLAAVTLDLHLPKIVFLVKKDSDS